MFKVIATIIIALVALAWAVLAAGVLFEEDESLNPEGEDNLCPFCGKVLALADDGLEICDCPETKAVLNAQYCEDHDVLYTGAQCPKCTGQLGRWL